VADNQSIYFKQITSSRNTTWQVTHDGEMIAWILSTIPSSHILGKFPSTSYADLPTSPPLYILQYIFSRSCHNLQRVCQTWFYSYSQLPLFANTHSSLNHVDLSDWAGPPALMGALKDPSSDYSSTVQAATTPRYMIYQRLVGYLSHEPYLEMCKGVRLPWDSAHSMAY